MVGAKFCEELVAAGLHERLSISVFGEEKKTAYNRVKLSTYVENRSHKALELRSRDWYAEHHISLQSDVRVEKIHRDSKELEFSDGQRQSYGILVLATGSRPFVPPIQGADDPAVFFYRTIDDLDEIISSAVGKKSAAVVGGGLLGIEAAQALQSLKLSTTIIERANFLMPQQLTQSAGELLAKSVEEQEIKVHVGVKSTEIERKNETLKLTLDDELDIETDLVLISAGIRPNSEIAEAAGFPVGVRGGVVVNDDLETEDPDIYAIGECALLHGRTYGLVAPGNAMAKHLAKRLAGKKVKALAPLDMSTRLKMLGVDVVTIGEPLQEGRRVEFSTEETYRSLIIGRKGKLIGALAIGPWDENGRVHEAYSRGQKITSKQERYFTEEGVLFPGAKIEDPALWSESRVVCNCTGTSKGAIMACLTNCQNDPDRVASCTGASTICGSCRPLVDQLCGASPTTSISKKSVIGLLTASILSLGLVSYSIVGPPAEMASSVESLSYKIDQLWRDNLIKQITGYSLMTIFIVGLLISLRKRLAWFTWGKFASWRFFHAVFGLVSLGALWMHTGFHFGSNLNWWLMFVFVALNLLGAIAGIVAAMEARGNSEKARILRPFLTRAHLILFWPLPVLLTFHILSVYLY